MNTQSIEKEIVRLEHSFWQAMQDNDMDTMISLSDESCIIAGAQGVSKVRREDYQKMVESAPYKIIDFKISDDYQITAINKDTAVIAYKVSENLIVDDKPVKMEASNTSTWVRKNGNWVCSMHTESVLGDPFGRDKERHGPDGKALQ